MILPQKTTAEETRAKAKELYLTHQRNQILQRLASAGKSEQRATIRQIDGFLSVLSEDQKTFWLKVRENIERLTERDEIDAFCDCCDSRTTADRAQLEKDGWHLGQREQFCPKCNR